jgi:hypothetical protein
MPKRTLHIKYSSKAMSNSNGNCQKNKKIVKRKICAFDEELASK